MKYDMNMLKVFEAAIENAYDGLIILDADANILFANSACEKMEGVSKEMCEGKNIRDLLKEGVFSDSVALRVIETGKSSTMIQTTANKNQVLVTGTPIFVKGKLVYIVVNSRDISELNRLKQKLYESETLANRYYEEYKKMELKQIANKQLICKSKQMQKIISLVSNIAATDATILITGESGTGKGRIASFIHENSKRKNHDLIKVDCATISDNLFESELFGYEKGAFTGGDPRGKIGFVQLADKGTLFLDEIGEVPLNIQSKLLTLIQDKTIYKVGGKEKKHVDIRILAATNKNLEEMVEKGTFRKDLYYRLNVIPVHMPPLRERKEEILPLINDVSNRINEKYALSRVLSPAVKKHLIDYPWPGNIRELENVIERLILTATEDSVDIDLLPERFFATNFSHELLNEEGLKAMISKYEKMILKSFMDEGLSPLQIAKKLKVDGTTIRRKLHKYNLY